MTAAAGGAGVELVGGLSSALSASASEYMHTRPPGTAASNSSAAIALQGSKQGRGVSSKEVCVIWSARAVGRNACARAHEAPPESKGTPWQERGGGVQSL